MGLQIHLTNDLTPPASLLHDVLDKKYVTPSEAEDPYTYFLPLFTSMASTHGLDLVRDGRAELISKIVSNVSWTTEKKLREQGLWSGWHEACLELHCVQDADRLDAIGAFGRYSPTLTCIIPPSLRDWHHPCTVPQLSQRGYLSQAG
jgi:hypothetical protein